MKVDYAQVLEACKRNDTDAQRILYEEFSPSMLGIGIRYLKSRDEAQDLLHDAFIKVFEKIKEVKNPAALPAWMHRVMVTTILSYLRESKALMYVDTDTLQDAEQYRMPLDTDGYELDTILEAISTLPDAYRAVFNMREVDGMEFADIAKALGIKEVTVRTNLIRARKLLRTKLQ